MDKSENRWNMSQLPSNGLMMVDLFCGAGIGAVGFQLAGFDIVNALDNQTYAVDAYNQNIGHHATVGDVRELRGTDFPEADVITGGFPCKPYSLIGKGEGVLDEKNGDLGAHFLRIVKENRPKSFLFENVGGLLSKKHRDAFDALVVEGERMGYRVTWAYLNAWEYGVPQKRKRVFVVGLREDLNTSYTFPLPTPLEQRKTIRDAIGDLPEPDEADIPNHRGYGLRRDELPFAHLVPAGGNWRELPVEAQQVFLGGAYHSKGGRTGFLRKVDFSTPSWTLTSCMNGKNNAQLMDVADKYSDPLRTGTRRFTVRECLRLQTVPDWFVFPANLSLARQYERCSGIPSLVAYQLGIQLAGALKKDIRPTQAS